MDTNASLNLHPERSSSRLMLDMLKQEEPIILNLARALLRALLKCVIHSLPGSVHSQILADWAKILYFNYNTSY
ncbi:MAG: hypothetical protein GY754_44970 [bacterium]|nr:hypothetical protein [bacterium]